MNEEQLEQMRNDAKKEVDNALNELETNHPGITEGMATALGSGAGAAGSLTALSALGVPGLSAAGITSGLAAAGALVGGGMVAGIFVLATPVAVLGTLGYGMAKGRKDAKSTAALNTAIQKLYQVQKRLMQNAEHFAQEIAVINAQIDFITKEKPS